MSKPNNPASIPTDSVPCPCCGQLYSKSVVAFKQKVADELLKISLAWEAISVAWEKMEDYKVLDFAPIVHNSVCSLLKPNTDMRDMDDLSIEFRAAADTIMQS